MNNRLLIGVARAWGTEDTQGWRHAITPRVDVGVSGSLLHAWDADTYEYAAGPVVGCSPIGNAWISLGCNLRGFHDRDFNSAHYAAQGPFLEPRFRFDQRTEAGDGS